MKALYLPKKLIELMKENILNSSGIDYRTKNNFLRCVNSIYHHQIRKFQDKNIYVALGSAYWKEVFGGNYYPKVIQPLLELGIIESHDFGYRNVGKNIGLVGIRYRINPDLLDEDFEEINYLKRDGVWSANEFTDENGQTYMFQIPDKNFHISIDQSKVSKWIEQNAEGICHEFLNREFVRVLPDNLSIEYSEYIDNGTYNTQHLSIKALKNLSQTIEKELFFFKDRFYIANVDEFLKNRIAGMIYHYKQEISKINKVKVINERSKVTLRIYNHLVNFPSKILHFITINSKPIVQLDLRTSQLLLFANILNVYLKNGEEFLLKDFKNKTTKTFLKRLFKVLAQHKAQLPASGVDIHNSMSMEQSTSDVINFIRDVFFHDFYSVLQQELKLPTRDLAKLVVFKLLFKKSNKPDLFVEMFAKRYPVVMSIIAGFKDTGKSKSKVGEDSKENNFSVFLQCIESEIFIDKVLIPLREKDIPCFTRHDSVVVAEGYQKDVEDHVRKVFDDLDFRYNQVVEEKFWDNVDYEFLDEIGFIDWLIDENELNSLIYTEESLLNKNHKKMNNEHQEVMDKLLKIGLHEDYFSFVDAEFLEELSELPTLSQQQKNLLYDDIINLRDGFRFLSEETNVLLKRLVKGTAEDIF
jgi:hypothetical protein